MSEPTDRPSRLLTDRRGELPPAEDLARRVASAERRVAEDLSCIRHAERMLRAARESFGRSQQRLQVMRCGLSMRRAYDAAQAAMPPLPSLPPVPPLDLDLTRPGDLPELPDLMPDLVPAPGLDADGRPIALRTGIAP